MMPYYLYRCQNCQTKIAVEQSMYDDPVLDCEGCNSEESLVRDYSDMTFNIEVSGPKVGDVVKKYISDTKDDLRQQREELKEKNGIF